MDRAFEQISKKYSDKVRDEGSERHLSRKEKHSKHAVEKEQKPADAIEQILQANKEKDYFKMLQLPYPGVDELDRPVWSCTSSDVSRAFRKLSILVHPDKNPGSEARQAFETLTEANRLLKDPARLEEILKEYSAKAVADRDKRESRASVDERIQLNASKNSRAKVLRKEEGKTFQDEILKQMQRRQAEAKRKKEAASRYRRDEEEEEQHWQAAEKAAEEDADTKRQEAKRRKKPVFI